MPDLGKAVYTLIFDTREAEVAVTGMEARADEAAGNISKSMGMAENSVKGVGAVTGEAAGQVGAATGEMSAGFQKAGEAAQGMGAEIVAGSEEAGVGGASGAAKFTTAWNAAALEMDAVGKSMGVAVSSVGPSTVIAGGEVGQGTGEMTAGFARAGGAAKLMSGEVTAASSEASIGATKFTTAWDSAALRMDAVGTSMGKTVSGVGPATLAAGDQVAQGTSVMTTGFMRARAAAKGMGGEVAAADALAAGASEAAAAKSATAWGAASTKMGEVGKKLRGIGKKMTSKVTLPVAIIAGLSVKEFLDFSQKTKLLRTQAGATTAEMERMRKSVLEFDAAGQSSFGPKALADALFHIESVGDRGAEALDALKTASDGAAAGNADLESTTYALVSAQETQMKGTMTLHDAMANINAIVGSGDMHLQDLTSALSTGVLPAAKSAGLGIVDVGAALDTMTSRGMPAQISATRLAMSFAMMQKPTAAAMKALKKLGLGQFDLANEMRKHGLPAALELLRDRLIKVQDPSKRAALVLQAFGGGKSGKAMLLLLQNLDDMKHRYSAIIQKQKDYDAAVKAAKAEPLYKLKAAWAQIQVSLIKIGAIVTPIVAKIMKGIVAVGKAFNALPKSVQTIIVVLMLLLAVLGPLLSMIGFMVIGIGGLITAGGALVTVFGLLANVTKLWTAAVWLLNLAMDANPIGIVILALAALAVGFYIAYKKSATFRAIVHAVWDVLKSVFGWVSKNWPLLAAILVGPFAVAGYLIYKFHNAIINPLKSAYRWIVKNWPMLAAILGGPFGAAAYLVYRFRSKIFNGLMAIPGLIKRASVFIYSEAKALGKGIVTGIWDGMKNMGSWLGDKMKSGLKKAVNFVKSGFGIFSPSRFTSDEIGKPLGQGVTRGFSRGIVGLRGAMRRSINVAAAGAGVAASRDGAMVGREFGNAFTRAVIGSMKIPINKATFGGAIVPWAGPGLRQKPIKGHWPKPPPFDPNLGHGVALVRTKSNQAIADAQKLRKQGATDQETYQHLISMGYTPKQAGNATRQTKPGAQYGFHADKKKNLFKTGKGGKDGGKNANINKSADLSTKAQHNIDVAQRQVDLAKQGTTKWKHAMNKLIDAQQAAIRQLRDKLARTRNKQLRNELYNEITDLMVSIKSEKDDLTPDRKKKKKKGSSSGSLSHKDLWTPALRIALAKAERTKTKTDDIKVYDAEKRHLEILLKHTKNMKERATIEEEITSVDKKLVDLKKKEASATQKAITGKELQAAMDLRGSFFGEFASDIFHTNATGALEMGGNDQPSSGESNTTTVTQNNTYHEIPKDRYKESRRVRRALEAAVM